MWAAGKRKKSGTIVNRKFNNYRNPKVFNRRYTGEKSSVKVNRRTVENFIIILVLLIVVYFLFFSPYFKVKDVFIEGNKTVSVEDIQKEIPSSGNLILLKTGPIKNKIKQMYPQVKEIAIFKGLPNAIKIQIVEREQSLIWQTTNKRYLVDPNGYVSREVLDGEEISLPIVADLRNRSVSANEYLVSADFIIFVTYLNQHFFEQTNLNATAFSIDETSYDLIVDTDSGIKVFFDTTRSAQGGLEDLKQILINYRDNIHEYIDLRVESWGYYK